MFSHRVVISESASERCPSKPPKRPIFLRHAIAPVVVTHPQGKCLDASVGQGGQGWNCRKLWHQAVGWVEGGRVSVQGLRPKGSNFVEQDHPSELFRVEPGFNVSISMGSMMCIDVHSCGSVFCRYYHPLSIIRVSFVRLRGVAWAHVSP